MIAYVVPCDMVIVFLQTEHSALETGEGETNEERLREKMSFMLSLSGFNLDFREETDLTGS